MLTELLTGLGKLALLLFATIAAVKTYETYLTHLLNKNKGPYLLTVTDPQGVLVHADSYFTEKAATRGLRRKLERYGPGKYELQRLSDYKKVFTAALAITDP